VTDRSGRTWPLLRNPEARHRLERDGYVRVPFLGPEGVDRLTRLWAEFGSPLVEGIYSNLHDSTPEQSRAVHEVIHDEFRGPVERLFQDARIGGSSFLVKGCGEQSASTLHQDWCVVDEDLAGSLSVWVPLVDVDERNGALQVLPGTHRMRRSIRSFDTSSRYLDFDEVGDLAVCVRASAGDAVLYAHDLFHGSRANTTDQIRVAAVAGLVANGTGLCHYRAVGPTEDDFERLDVDWDFFERDIAVLSAGGTVDRRGVACHVDHHLLDVDEVLDHARRCRMENRPSESGVR